MKLYSYKKIIFYLTLILLAIFLVFLVAAIGLIENNTWGTNLTGVGFGTVSFGDLNNDNRSDLLLTGCLPDGSLNCENGAIAKVYLNNGTTLNESILWQVNLTGVGSGSTALGDLNNDGLLDLALMGCTSFTGTPSCNGNIITKIYTNNGTSLNENIYWQQNLTGLWYGNLAFGDVDNDGRLDLAIIGTTSSSKIVKIYTNNGTSLNENIYWQQNLTGLDESSLTFLDVENNGLLDLAITGEDSASNKKTAIYINNGSSLVSNDFWQKNIIATDQGNINVGDYDNDADIDILLMGCCDLLRTYINNGSTFIQSQIEGSGVYPDLGGGLFDGSTAFGDYDNDGDLDFVGVGAETGRSEVYKNNGTGGFSFDNGAGSGISPKDFQYAALAWNDLDNDNDLDVVISGNSLNPSSLSSVIYISNTSLTLNNTIPTSSTSFSNSTLINGDVFLSWGNGSDNQTPSNGLYYNLRVGTTSAGNQIVSSVYGGSSGGAGQSNGAVSGYFGNMMQRKNISLKASRFQVGVTYYWSIQTIDTALAKSEWSIEKTFTLTSDFIPPTITLNAPADNLVTNVTLIIFNSTVVDDYNLTNVSLYGNWSGGWHLNTTNSSGINNTDYIFRNNLTEGTHLWGIRACDNTANCIGSNQTFRIDITSPIVALTNPINGSSWTTANTINFTYNVSDLGISNCSLIINGLTNRTNTSIAVNQTQNFTTNLPNGNYNWSMRCADQANNVNFTGNYSLTVSYTAPSGDTGGSTSSGSSGGGGGGGGTSSLSIVSRILTSVIAGENKITFTEIEKKNTGIEEIIINSNSPATNAKIIIEKLKHKPADVELDPQGDVYSYLRFDKTILTDNNLESIIIKFTVNRSWVLDNNYQAEDVALSHYTTSWDKLPTKFLSSDSILYHYEAETKSFSYFAINAEGKAVLEENNTIKGEEIQEPQLPTEESLEEQVANEPEQRNKLYWIIPLTALILISSIIIYLKTRIKPKKKS